jgi:hypothetical protein
MTQRTLGYATKKSATHDRLNQLRRDFAEPITLAELSRLWHPRTPRIVVIARYVFVLAFITILASTVLGLRVVGSG